jgi:hypothetical protein
LGHKTIGVGKARLVVVSKFGPRPLAACPITFARYVLHDPVIRTLLLIVLGTNVAMMGPLYVGGPFSPSRASGVQGPLEFWSPPQESVR